MSSGEQSHVEEAPTVLVVDDAPTNRFIVKSALKSAGYRVVEAQSGEQCLELCRTQPPSIVLLDYMMPGMDGLTTCQELRKKYSRDRLPILIVTGTAESEKLADAFASGASDYVMKPIDRAVLLARVSGHLEMQRSYAELAQALEIQRALGEMIPQALVVERSRGDILYANSQVPSELLSKGVAGIFNAIFEGAARVEFERAQSRLLREPLGEIDFEARSSARAGRSLAVSSRAFAMPNGEILRLWMWKDTTATRELERKVNERVRLDMVSLFVGGVAHNFNNMLMSVAGAAEMLSRSMPPDPKNQRLLKIITDGVGAATKFCRKMNVFSRPDVEGMNGSGESVEEIIQAAILPLESEFGGRIIFEYSCEPQLPPTSMPLQHLSEAMANVLRNAAESIEGEGIVSTSLTSDPERTRLMVTVTDSGAGMSHEVLDRIFEPFFSTKNLDERNAVSMRGNGLGLWNTYNLLKLAGGDIAVESSAGQGTVCTLVLPIKSVEPHTNHS